jgi:glycosyltransferase involved in cell wall biosynthesis
LKRGGLRVTNPLVSVVMTVKNVQSTIDACLRSILSQTFEDFEIIVIDDYSTDRTAKIIRALDDKRINYFKNEKWLGITPSRNRGIQRTRGAFIFFTDGDCIASKNWI